MLMGFVVARLTGLFYELSGSLQQLAIYLETFARALAAYCVIKRSQGAWFLIAAGVLLLTFLALNTGSLYHLITRVMLIGIVLTSSTRSLSLLYLRCYSEPQCLFPFKRLSFISGRKFGTRRKAQRNFLKWENSKSGRTQSSVNSPMMNSAERNY